MPERFNDLEQLGLIPDNVEVLLSYVRREVDEGLLPGAQLALARHGKVGVMAAYGSADHDSLICLFSATKGIVSAAAWLLFQANLLSEDEYVADIIPEFGSNGKEQVQVGQLLAHTAGFPHAPFSPLDWTSRSKRLARFAQWRLNWPPGSRYEYHPSSSMWVVAELIERRTGLDFSRFIQECVLQRLGLESIFVGLPAHENERVLPVEHRGEAPTAEDYRALNLAAMPGIELSEQVLYAFNRPEVRAVGVPGAGGFAKATDLALFYQALLRGGLGGAELWSKQTLIDARSIRSGEFLDPMFNQPANRGLGIIVSGDSGRVWRGFGKSNSPLAFGHNGVGGQLAWADPATGLSLAYLTPGHDRNFVRQWQRGSDISDLAAKCAD